MVRELAVDTGELRSTSSPTLSTARASSTRSRPSSEARSWPSTPLPQIDHRAADVDLLHHTLDDRALGIVGRYSRRTILGQLFECE